MTLAKLAEALGVSRAHLSSIETGKSQPSPDLAAKLDAILGVSMHALLDERPRLDRQTAAWINRHPDLVRALRRLSTLPETAVESCVALLTRWIT
ncbi:MAG: hypothetical protein KatS3mg082_1439 [Nitrospiraceae bacterium]|nr:MAG: hypothetical protein KatS3mg082_1439 [Nitrospiraceae bacterium]